MTKKENIERMTANLERRVSNPPILGGQSCGMPITYDTIICPETGFTLSVQYYRSRLKNLDYMIMLYQLYLDDILK